MVTKMTLEKIERQAVRLPFQEQLELVSRLSNRLTKIIPHPGTERKRGVVRRVASILRECDAAAKAFSQNTNSGETIRRIREERHASL